MRYLYISLLLLWMQPVLAQEKQVQTMSLKACTDYALEHSYAIKNAQLDVLIQEAQNSQTASAALPSVGGKYEMNYFPRVQQSFLNGKVFGGPDGIIPVAFTIPFSSTASLNASQILFDGSVLVALQARNTVLQLAQQKAQLTKEELAYNIFKSYYTVVVGRQQYNILTKSIGFLREITHEMEVTYANGLVEKIEVERLNVQLNNLINDSLSTVNGLQLAEQVLKYQMGMDIYAPLELEDAEISLHVKSALSIINDQPDYNSISAYRLAQTGVKLNEYNLRRYKLAALPTIVGIGSFGANYGAEYLKNLYKFKSYESYSLVGLQANINIFGGMKRQYQVKETQLSIEKSRNDLENARLSIDFQTAQARTSLRNAVLQLKSQQQNLTLAEDVLQLAQKKYRAGVGSNLEVTTAQTDQLKTQNAYYVTLLNIIDAEADLKKALGMFK